VIIPKFHRFRFVSNQNSIHYNGPIHIFPKYSNKQDDDDSGSIQDLSKSRVWFIGMKD